MVWPNNKIWTLSISLWPGRGTDPKVLGGKPWPVLPCSPSLPAPVGGGQLAMGGASALRAYRCFPSCWLRHFLGGLYKLIQEGAPNVHKSRSERPSWNSSSGLILFNYEPPFSPRVLNAHKSFHVDSGLSSNASTLCPVDVSYDPIYKLPRKHP